MKRAITIITILIAIVAIFLTVSWLISRRTATKNNATPQSFREFITGTASPSTTPTNTGDLTSDFTTDPNQSSPSTPSSRPGSQNGPLTTNTSTFTNAGVNPSGQTPTQSPSGGGVAAPGDINTTPTPPRIATALPDGLDPTLAAPACTDADLNITFTQAELDRLQALQDDFYTIAQSLHNDADVQTQIANYTAFKLKQKNMDDLLSYCTQTLTPNIPSTPRLKNRVPTPFWYELADIRPNPTFNLVGLTLQRGTGEGDAPLGYVMGPGQIGAHVTGMANDHDVFVRSMERLLRLSLW